MTAPGLPPRNARGWLAGALFLGLAQLPVAAQAPSSGWEAESPAAQGANTTVVPRSTPGARPGGPPGNLSVTAHLIDNSPPIAQGLVWRIFRERDGGAPPQLVSTHKEASPVLRLEPGTYRINVAYGRANLTRKVVIGGDQPAKEKFVLNAGGLRVMPMLAGGEPANDKLVSFDIESDERDQYGQRTKVATGAKARLVLRLNAGNYSIVSTYGDANAVVRADVSVEAGKLSEVSLTHPAAQVSFKLVTREGGDAIADTQWTVLSAQGDTVKESSGALPSHMLAPGTYTARARHAGRDYRRDFAVKAGDNVHVEVVMP
jgi:hypothetical protein